MPEWLKNDLQIEAGLSAGMLAGRIGLAALLGLVAAVVHLLTQNKRAAETASFSTTLVLLTVLIAMVNLVIGNSVARAFSLVGALAIVRFRTVVDDTRDTAFVIFAVVMGMAAGAGYLAVALVGAPIVTAAAFVMQWWGAAANGEQTWHVSVRVVAGADIESLCGALLDQRLRRRKLASISTARQGAALDAAFRGASTDADIQSLLKELNQLEGVQSVECKLG